MSSLVRILLTIPSPVMFGTSLETQARQPNNNTVWGKASRFQINATTMRDFVGKVGFQVSILGRGWSFKNMDLFGAIHLGLNDSFMSLVFVKFQGLKKWKEKVNMEFWEGLATSENEVGTLKNVPLVFGIKHRQVTNHELLGFHVCLRGLQTVTIVTLC